MEREKLLKIYEKYNLKIGEEVPEKVLEYIKKRIEANRESIKK